MCSSDLRPAFTDPEIVRSNLAAVILRMASLRLGAVVEFPFIDPPSARLIADGYDVLHELGAVSERGELTPLGRELARIPVDPKIGRMLLAARDYHCLREMLVLVSALSIQDPRERPADKQAQADQQHARFKDEHSDFVTMLNVWSYVRAKQKELMTRIREAKARGEAPPPKPSRDMRQADVLDEQRHTRAAHREKGHYADKARRPHGQRRLGLE
mgnify:CR=1 FL=1